MRHPLTDKVQNSLGLLGALESHETVQVVDGETPNLERRDGTVTVQIPPNTPASEIEVLLFDLTA